jgi:predicted RNA-binding protein with EMAP domain
MGLKKSLEKFRSVLEQENNLLDKELKGNVEYAVGLINAALKDLEEKAKEKEVIQSMEGLAYMVSDSLPWSEKILSSWEKVEKAFGKFRRPRH